MSDFAGSITVTARLEGPPRLDVTPGRMRITTELLVRMSGDFVDTSEDGFVTFRGEDDEGEAQAYRYRIAGAQAEPTGFVWIELEPADE